MWRLCSSSPTSSYPALTREKHRWNVILNHHHILVVSASGAAHGSAEEKREHADKSDIMYKLGGNMYVIMYELALDMNGMMYDNVMDL
jgi:hypothetical protein